MAIVQLRHVVAAVDQSPVWPSIRSRMKVGMPVVAGVLLDHVQVDPADVPDSLGMMPAARHDGVEGLVRHRCVAALISSREAARLAAASADRGPQSRPVWSGIVGKFRSCWLRACGTTSARPRSCVAPVQARTTRRRTARLFELLDGEPRALPQQGVAVIVQPFFKGSLGHRLGGLAPGAAPLAQPNPGPVRPDQQGNDP